MSEKTLVSKSRRLDNILDRKEDQGMIQHIKSKLHSGVNIHTTRARGGSLLEEAIEKLERFKVRTVNILVGGEADEEKK
ncbi:hypothetical protein BRARA_D02222 [Brassica rapa]|uniref:Uncharacterized protein n=2 Tax=Brassica TaxID=3705 RepID=A0A397ZNK7_BRACM|nr:hypothetical protein BRARA_D02222 [Brassica rapa]CAF1867879.1 unnamed protein product [Brassica napus]CAG7908021.1 unnamed protein product [Brassica rapa]